MGCVRARVGLLASLACWTSCLAFVSEKGDFKIFLLFRIEK
uniref:Uncharacterized protein n=1 Tax=Rhizophora mucronata TaxID=61149 RepID=A0A2P2IW98_RHIMU